MTLFNFNNVKYHKQNTRYTCRVCRQINLYAFNKLVCGLLIHFIKSKCINLHNMAVFNAKF